MFEKWNETIIVNGIEKHVEVRWDEIFERYCRIIDRVGLELTKQEDFSHKIKEPCIFCSRRNLAKFDEKFEMEKENENAFIFPNINPYAKYSSVVALKKHYLQLNEFSPKMIEDMLHLSFGYIEAVKKMDGIAYVSINSNYLMPAGASILHPHAQVVADEHPTSYMKKIAGNEVFHDYIMEELKSERYIKRIGKVYLFAPFAPFGFNEVFGLVEEIDIKDIAKAISLILSYFHSIKRNTFNFSIYYSLNNDFPMHFRIITRQNMAAYYRNDAMFFERLHMETILEKKPEEIAKEIKEFLI